MQIEASSWGLTVRLSERNMQTLLDQMEGSGRLDGVSSIYKDIEPYGTVQVIVELDEVHYAREGGT